MTAPTRDTQRPRACLTVTAAKSDPPRTVEDAAVRPAAHRDEARAFKDHLPLTDADWAAVYLLAHGLRPFAAHTGPAAPRSSERPRGEQARRMQRHERSRLRATADAERWLAIWALDRGGSGAPTIAELLGVTEKQVERWRARPVVGWPHGVDAVLLPQAGAGPVQDTTNTRACGSTWRRATGCVVANRWARRSEDSPDPADLEADDGCPISPRPRPKRASVRC